MLRDEDTGPDLPGGDQNPELSFLLVTLDAPGSQGGNDYEEKCDNSRVEQAEVGI